jgi:D-alanyl-D-alanine carboxypeptidase (penicillin-binding protein 5/6)
VVLGTDSREARASESQKLLNWGWTAWDAVRLFEPGKTIFSAPVWKGEAREVSLVAETPGGGLWVSVPRGEGDKLRTAVERTEPLLAPLVAGQRVGTIKVTTAGGAAVATVPLVAQQPVPLAGFFGRTWDAVRLWIR